MQLRAGGMRAVDEPVHARVRGERGRLEAEADRRPVESGNFNGSVAFLGVEKERRVYNA